MSIDWWLAALYVAFHEAVDAATKTSGGQDVGMTTPTKPSLGSIEGGIIRPPIALLQPGGPNISSLTN
jgi:hypothetical protein